MCINTAACRYITLLAMVMVSGRSVADDLGCNETKWPDNTPVEIAQIEITNNAIFDESDPETLALHRWANWLHVNTKEDVVAARLPFKEGDVVDQKDIEEAERLIRNESYLRDAVVDFSRTCEVNQKAKVKVRTWDNWSTLPTLSFSRKGGENRFAIGISEDNLLGMGIRTRAMYQSDAQRTGYRFTFRAPVPYLDHATAFLDLEDNDDGQRTQIIFDQPFYTFDTQTSTYLNLLSDSRTQEIFQNGGTRNIFDFKGRSGTVSYGNLWYQQQQYTARLRYGFTLDEADFYVPSDAVQANQVNLPTNRRFLYPWIEAQWIESDYRVMNDIYLINQKEDINLGWQHSLRLGVETRNNQDATGQGYHLAMSTRTGYQWHNSLLLMSAFANAHVNVQADDFWQVSSQVEYFYRPSKLFAWYGKASALVSDNRFLDYTNALGGENGVRGYPLQYQHGDISATLTGELRYYPNLNLWKLLDVGFVAFSDFGKAWRGPAAQDNEEKGIIGSIGIGARIYSNRSSHRNVIHLDFAKPFQSNENVDSWQWRAMVKESF